MFFLSNLLKLNAKNFFYLKLVLILVLSHYIVVKDKVTLFIMFNKNIFFRQTDGANTKDFCCRNSRHGQA